MSKKWKNRLMVILLPVIAIAVTGLSIWASQNIDNIESEIRPDNDLNYRNVYMLSDTDLVVPLTVSFPKKDFPEDLTYVISLMKEGSILTNKGFKAVLPGDTCINKINVENKVANIDFCSTFAEYKANNELRVLESLVWTATQYSEIDAITISMEGEILKLMPVANTPLPSTLNRTIGINNLGIVGNNIYQTTSITVYYERTINNQNILIPITRKVPSKSSELETYLSEVFNPVSDLVGFSKPTYVKRIKTTSQPYIEDNQMYIDLDIAALEDETSLNRNLYNYLILSFQTMNLSKINISVNGEAVQVSGYDVDIDDIATGSLHYNEIQL